MRIQLHCIARIRVVYLKEVDLLASLMVQSSSRRAPFLLGPQRQNVGLVLTVHHGRKDSLSRDH
uniref:Ycf15 n=1 Tax=Rourea microphylla TaxID=1603828 RepID=A0A8E8PE49_9ROSI|nr:Ycf15 [Rourea microphylla]QWE50448.1 Ycf15 [Rourea microphylla]